MRGGLNKEYKMPRPAHSSLPAKSSPSSCSRSPPPPGEEAPGRPPPSIVFSSRNRPAASLMRLKEMQKAYRGGEGIMSELSRSAVLAVGSQTRL